MSPKDGADEEMSREKASDRLRGAQKKVIRDVVNSARKKGVKVNKDDTFNPKPDVPEGSLIRT